MTKDLRALIDTRKSVTLDLEDCGLFLRLIVTEEAQGGAWKGQARFMSQGGR